MYLEVERLPVTEDNLAWVIDYFFYRGVSASV